MIDVVGQWDKLKQKQKQKKQDSFTSLLNLTNNELRLSAPSFEIKNKYSSGRENSLRTIKNSFILITRWMKK